MKHFIAILIVFATLVSCGGVRKKSATAQAVEPTFYTYEIVAEYPHSRTSYTQGLQFVDGELWEGTGEYGNSRILRSDLVTGKVLTSHANPKEEFGEGITVLGDKIYHLTWLDYRGLPCECGNRGCLEMYANTSVMLEKLRKVTGKNFSFAEFCQIQGDHGVDAIFLQMIEDISVVLVNMVNILQPELIVLGHDCTDWQDAHVRYLEKLINEKKLVNNHRRIPVRKAYFKKDALLVGAAANVVNYVFMGNLLFS